MSYLTTPAHSLTGLAKEIEIQASRLQRYFEDTGIPQPTFDQDGPEEVLSLGVSSNAHEARAKLVDAAYKLYQLATGPSEFMATVRANFQTSSAIHWILHFRIPLFVPLHSSIHYDELAGKAGVPAARLRSVMRLAMTSGLFAETGPDMVEHTSASRYFTKPARIEGNLLSFEVTVPISNKMAAATEKWPRSLAKNETAQNLAFGHDLSFFDWLAQNPPIQERFAMYMQELAQGQGMNNKHLIESFQLDELPRSGCVVDVGGSMGHCAVALAGAYPNLHFKIQDIIADDPKTQDFVTHLAPDIRARIEHQKHDFFDPQPERGAAVYLLRMILHDWSDENAKRILQRLAEALGSHSVVAIMDTVLPEPGSLPATSERQIRLRDVTMMIKFNAKERTLQDWEAIVGSVSPPLVIKKVHQPQNSDLAMIVVGLAGTM